MQKKLLTYQLLPPPLAQLVNALLEYFIKTMHVGECCIRESIDLFMVLCWYEV